MIFILFLISTCMYASFSSCMDIKAIAREVLKHQQLLEQKSKLAIEPQYNFVMHTQIEPQYNPVMHSQSDILIHFAGNPIWYNKSFDMQMCCFIRKLSVLNKEINHALVQLHPAFFKIPSKMQRKTRPRALSYDYATTW